ncbi:MAG: hypothetical protein IPJ20_14760 [Flammeovirgaceae bacterium]|jgi:hypothetical protein|nr:hypothetical protein [Flammeovirgaceae bacterium]
MKENYEFGYLSVKAMLLFAVLNQQEETIKNMAFKFMDGRKFYNRTSRVLFDQRLYNP